MRNKGYTDRLVFASTKRVRNPNAVLAEYQNKPFPGPQFISIGRTMDIGRNKSKQCKKDK